MEISAAIRAYRDITKTPGRKTNELMLNSLVLGFVFRAAEGFAARVASKSSGGGGADAKPCVPLLASPACTDMWSSAGLQYKSTICWHSVRNEAIKCHQSLALETGSPRESSLGLRKVCKIRRSLTITLDQGTQLPSMDWN